MSFSESKSSSRFIKQNSGFLANITSFVEIFQIPTHKPSRNIVGYFYFNFEIVKKMVFLTSHVREDLKPSLIDMIRGRFYI